MKIQTTFIALASIFTVSMIGWTIENPNVGNPFQRQNAPAYSGQTQRFITQPNTNTYGQTGNDIVTGNIGGGKHFRGVVPYGSSYYSSAFSRSSGTASVNQFLRRSSDPLVNDRNPGQVSGYFDPRRTVSSLRRLNETSGLSIPQSPPQGRKSQFLIPVQSQFLKQSFEQRPLSSNVMDLDQILARQEELRRQAKEQKTGDAEELPEKKNFFDITLRPELDLKTEEPPDKKNFFEITLRPELDLKTEAPPVEDETEPKVPPEQQLLEDIQKEQAEAMANKDSILLDQDDSEDQSDDVTSDRLNPKSDLVPDLDAQRANLAAEGRKILGEHETFQSLAESKFAEYMDAAEGFLQEGQFYKAADSYSLATVWKPRDARAYLGRSFSLFAAGEYMSSAFYLARAFELDEKVPLKQYDLADFVGDRDIYENRVLEMAAWQERSGSGELAFLLAYVSYQDNRSARAVNAIKMAKEVMPDNRAVIILKHVIDPEPLLQ